MERWCRAPEPRGRRSCRHALSDSPDVAVASFVATVVLACVAFFDAPAAVAAADAANAMPVVTVVSAGVACAVTATLASVCVSIFAPSVLAALAVAAGFALASAAGAAAPVSEAAAAMAAAAIASGAVAVSVGAFALEASTVAVATGITDATALAVTSRCRILIRFGLIGGRSAFAGSGLAFRLGLIRFRRVGLGGIRFRLGAAGCVGVGVCFGVVAGVAAGIAVAGILARVAARGLVGCRFVRSRLVRCGGVVARPVVRRDLRIIGASRRSVLGTVVAVGSGLVAVDQRGKAVVSGRLVGIRPPRPRRRALKRHVCQ